MKKRLLIGIDNGTQSTKCIVYSLDDARILASASAPHDLIERPDGTREQAPAWWTAAVAESLAKCLAHPDVDPRDVVAIGVSGQQHGFVPLDADGNVIRNARLWCDTATVAECDEITAAVGGDDAMCAEIGGRLAVGYTASKIRWMKTHEPDNYARLATVLLPHDYLNFWLTGRRVAESGDASGTGYFDVRKRAWFENVVNAIDPSGRLWQCLPELIDAREPVGTIRPEIADQFGLPRNVIVSSGGGDNMMAAIGTGNVVPGLVTASLGTSGTIYAYADAPVIDPAGEVAPFCSSTGGWLPLVCTMNVTVATELTRKLVGANVADYDALVAESAPGAGGMILVPYFNGERTPARPNARASLHGMASDNFTRANVCRAAMEGATMGLRYGLDALRRGGIAPAEILLTGGGSKSAVWRQLAANIFGCPIVCPESAEAGALGAALQAAWCYLNDTTIADLTRTHIRLDESTRAEPDAKIVAEYDEVYAKYLELAK